MSSGSSARLIARMVSSAGSPCSAMQIFHLALADAVLAGAGAVHGDGAFGQAFEKILGALDLVGVVEIDQQQHMEIAVADMADHRREKPLSAASRWVSRDAFGEPRDRHADVGRQRLRARPQTARRPIGVVPRLPQPGAVLGARRPIERPAAELLGDLAEALRLLGDARLGAVKFDETASALPAATASNRDCRPSPAAHRAVRCAPPECRTGW